MRVADYMVTDVTTLNHDASLLDASLLMRRSSKRHIPIIGPDGPVGILTDRDLARVSPSVLGGIQAEQYNELMESTTVENAMTKNPATVTPQTPIADAVHLLHQEKIGALLVVEGNKLVGILTVTDMLGLLHELLCQHAQSA